MDPPIEEFLFDLKLSDAYTKNFIDNGYHSLSTCEAINDDSLLQIGITKAGHRRRILSQIRQKTEEQKRASSTHSFGSNDPLMESLRKQSTDQSSDTDPFTIQDFPLPPPPPSLDLTTYEVINSYIDDPKEEEDRKLSLLDKLSAPATPKISSGEVFGGFPLDIATYTYTLPSPPGSPTHLNSHSLGDLPPPPHEYRDDHESEEEGIYDNISIPEERMTSSLSRQDAAKFHSEPNILSADHKEPVMTRDVASEKEDDDDDEPLYEAIEDISHPHKSLHRSIPIAQLNAVDKKKKMTRWRQQSTRELDVKHRISQESLPRACNSVSVVMGRSFENLTSDASEDTDHSGDMLDGSVRSGDHSDELFVKRSPKVRKKSGRRGRPISAFLKDSLMSVASSSNNVEAADTTMQAANVEQKIPQRHSSDGFQDLEDVTDHDAMEYLKKKRPPSSSEVMRLEHHRDRLLSGSHTSLASVDEVPKSPDIYLKKKKEGWLWKNGGSRKSPRQRQGPLQKRWVVFDGEELRYYESDQRMDISKGVIPIAVVLRVQINSNESKVFHIQTKGGRKYIFHTETPDDRNLWTSTLQAAKMYYEKFDRTPFKPGGSMYMPYKEGYLKMEGQKVYVATKGEEFAYYKSINEFNFGQPVSKLKMNLATVKNIVDKKKFQVIFPFRTFVFSTDNDEEKRLWIEALQDAVAESLSDYKVLTEISSVAANTICADCGCEKPDWASINLAIVICKHCAGIHRELGVHNSKVRSLKMDVKIWSEEMKNMIKVIGNDTANSFWSACLNGSDAINDMADKKQRAWHISNKYVELHYAKPHNYKGKQEELNRALIEAVCKQAIEDVYSLVFSGADPNCNTGKPYAKTPYLLAQHLKYSIIAEFLLQNGATSEASPFGHVTDRIANSSLRRDSMHKPKPPNTIRDYLYKYGGDFRNSQDENKSRGLGLLKSALQQGDFQRRLCIMENNMLRYYDADKQTVMKDEINCSELISIGLCQPEQATKAGMKHCFEVARKTGRTYLFSADRKETTSKWMRGFLGEIFPPYVQNALGTEQDFLRVGKLWVKTQFRSKKGSTWKKTWCALKGKNFKYFHQESKTMETLDLRRIIQLVIDKSQDNSTPPSPPFQQNGKDSSPVIMIVFREKTFYFRSDTKPDGESWFTALRKSDAECGPNLEDQQLSTTGAPIILEKCTTFVEQYGLDTRGIYRLSGTHSKTTQLLNNFTKNARETQMSEKDLSVHDVTSALKRWFKNLPGSLLTDNLHERWITTASLQDDMETQKLISYKELMKQLPELNRSTLRILLNHLNIVAQHEKVNDMSQNNLAIVFGPTLMVHDDPNEVNRKVNFGKTSEEIACINDLLKYFDALFDVTDVDRERERLMLEAKEKIVLATQQQNMLTTLDFEMLVPVYFENKDQCVNYKVNLTAATLVAKICKAKNRSKDVAKLSVFEVLNDGECERMLHHSEHVLSVIKTWPQPSSNYLLCKPDYMREKLRWYTINKPVNNTILQVPLRMYDTRKKWVKIQANLKLDDHDRLHLELGKVKGSNAIYLSKYNIYFGVDRKTKPPGTKPTGFTLAAQGETTRQFYCEGEEAFYKFIAQILLHKFPSGFEFPSDFVLEDESGNPSFEHTTPTSVSNQMLKLDLNELEASMVRKRGSDASILEEDETGGHSNLLQRGGSLRGGERSSGGEQDGVVPDSTTFNLQLPPSSGSVSSRGFPRVAGVVSPVQGQRGVMKFNLQSELSDVLKNRQKN